MRSVLECKKIMELSFSPWMKIHWYGWKYHCSVLVNRKMLLYIPFISFKVFQLNISFLMIHAKDKCSDVVSKITLGNILRSSLLLLLLCCSQVANNLSQIWKLWKGTKLYRKSGIDLLYLVAMLFWKAQKIFHHKIYHNLNWNLRRS